MSTCTVCDSPQLDEINAALKDGGSVREVAATYGLTKSAVGRHRQTCILRQEITRTAIERAQDLKAEDELQSAASLARELGSMKAVLAGYFSATVSTGKNLPLPLVRELRATQELLLKTMLLIEAREAPAQRSGLLEAASSVEYLRQHYPEALRGLAEHLGAGLHGGDHPLLEGGGDDHHPGQGHDGGGHV